MPRHRKPYPPEFKARMVELVRRGEEVTAGHATLLAYR